jgi:hypothetical protein
MPNKFVFADEAGCFTFERKPNVSRYFILCTVVADSCDVGTDLLHLRRRLAMDGAQLNDYFHACEDKQAVRDEVYKTIQNHDFSVQATIMEKSKAQAHVRSSRARFYQYGWYYHFKHGTTNLLGGAQAEALVTAASLGTRKERASFKGAVDDVMRQTVRARRWATDFWPASSDPCLQVADYCAWAIQRKWEKGDERSYDLIKGRITYEYDLWARGAVHHY